MLQCEKTEFEKAFESVVDVVNRAGIAEARIAWGGGNPDQIAALELFNADGHNGELALLEWNGQDYEIATYQGAVDKMPQFLLWRRLPEPHQLSFASEGLQLELIGLAMLGRSLFVLNSRWPSIYAVAADLPICALSHTTLEFAVKQAEFAYQYLIRPTN